MTLIRTWETCESLTVMNARPAKPPSLRRYRRRILGWGAVGIAAIFAVGGPIFVNRLEDDLERRSVVELEAAGVGDVTPSFSGQDGELRCLEGAVDIPDDVVASIRDLWGVSSLDVARSCIVGESVDDGRTGGDAAPSTDVGSVTQPAETAAADDVTTSTSVPAPDSVAAVVANDSQFSTLAGLLDDAGLNDTLGGEDSVTVFAPTDAAFEALGADVIGALARDPELLATVLLRHVTAGSLGSDDLEAGTIDMLDGTRVTVDLSDGVMLVLGDVTATVTEPDLRASNGVVHAIDRVLLSEGTVVATVRPAVSVGADFVDGQIVLRGTVASEVQQSVLISAAASQVDPANVTDELVVEDDSGVEDAAVEALADVIAAMPPNLVAGAAELTADGIAVTGTSVDAESGAAFDAAVADIAGAPIATITTAITERAVADADAAATLEADLNALVAADPILFDPSSTSISAGSAAILERVAALANRFSGVAIEIQGYTDTDGLASSNQALSEGRARSVLLALTDRGIPDDILSTVGFGGTVPVLDAAGTEDKAASRRVEFVVAVTQ